MAAWLATASLPGLPTPSFCMARTSPLSLEWAWSLGLPQCCLILMKCQPQRVGHRGTCPETRAKCWRGMRAGPLFTHNNCSGHRQAMGQLAPGIESLSPLLWDTLWIGPKCKSTQSRLPAEAWTWSHPASPCPSQHPAREKQELEGWLLIQEVPACLASRRTTSERLAGCTPQNICPLKQADLKSLSAGKGMTQLRGCSSARKEHLCILSPGDIKMAYLFW